MKTILTLLLVLVPVASFAGDDPVAELRAELSGLSLASPETDAQRDIATGRARCFSVNGYAKVFPGVPDQDRSYCESREKNFLGTSDAFMSEEHGKLIAQAADYAKRYNTYVLERRKK